MTLRNQGAQKRSDIGRSVVACRRACRRWPAGTAFAGGRTHGIRVRRRHRAGAGQAAGRRALPQADGGIAAVAARHRLRRLPRHPLQSRHARCGANRACRSRPSSSIRASCSRTTSRSSPCPMDAQNRSRYSSGSVQLSRRTVPDRTATISASPVSACMAASTAPTISTRSAPSSAPVTSARWPRARHTDFPRAGWH